MSSTDDVGPMGDDDWGSLMPMPDEVGARVPACPLKAGVMFPPLHRGPSSQGPTRREDDAEAAKTVDGLATKVLAGKKKLATIRTQMNAIDTKVQAIQSDIDELMPVLQNARTEGFSSGADPGRAAAARLAGKGA